MSLPNVNITLQNGALGGTIQTNDGIPGLVITGVAEGTIAIATPFVVTSLSEAMQMGLTAINNTLAYKTIKEFYDEAGDGASLYLMFSDLAVNEMASNINANGLKKLLNYAGGVIRFVGLLAEPDGTIANELDGVVYTAATNLQVLLNNYATNQQWPMRGIIGATNFTGTAASLTSMKGGSLNRVAILIGDTESGDSAAIGTLLGRLAAVPVQRKISRVKTGALVPTTMYIGDTEASQYTQTAAIADKGFITIRTFANKNGYFFSGDPTCTADTDDYSFVARGRVIDKAQILAYTTFVDEVDEEIPVEVDGKIDAAYAAYLQARIENQINQTMTANNEISAVSCFINTSQNVISTNLVKVVLKITPVGYASTIDVALGFYNPALGG